MAAPGPEFFIAHAGADAASAERLHAALVARGRTVFLDSRSLAPGDPWDVEIPRALAAARVAVVLIGARSGVAYYLREEIAVAIARARRGELRVVPVVLDAQALDGDAVPYGLRVLHTLDLQKLGLDGVVEQLLRLPGAAIEVAPARVELVRREHARALDAAALERSLAALLGASFEVNLKAGARTASIEGDAEAIAVLLDRLGAPDPAAQRFVEDLEVAELRAPQLEYHRAFFPPRAIDGAPELSWLHLSDIHVGHPDVGHAQDREEVLDQLFRDAKQMAKALGPPDLILVTGDVAFSGREAQYHTAAAWLARVCAAVGAPPSALAIVPGNHDVDRSVADGDPFVRTFHEGLADDGGAKKLDEVLASKRANELLLKLAAFARFAADHGSSFHGERAPWSSREVQSGLGPVVILGLNSALASQDEHDRDRLLLGRTQRQELFKGLDERGALVIALMHHPPSWLRDGAELLARLKRIPHVLLTGHVHASSASVSASLGAGGVTHISAGAVHGERGAPEAHGYAWGRLSRDGLAYYPRVWSRQHREFVADLEHKPGADGSVREERDRLPRPLTAWLTPPAVEAAPEQLGGVEPGAAENDSPPGSLAADLAYQLDRTLQWAHLGQAYKHRYAVLMLAGHERQTLPLFVERCRRDLERHAKRLTGVWEVPFREVRGRGPLSGAEWLGRIARAARRPGKDAYAAMLAAAKDQDVLLVLGPIPEPELGEQERGALIELLTKDLASFLDAVHATGSTHGFRTLVLVDDGLPVEAKSESELVRMLKTAAAGAGRGAVIGLPRARFPEWEDEIEPVLDHHGASEAQRRKVRDAYDELKKSDKLTFEMFAVFLARVLKSG